MLVLRFMKVILLQLNQIAAFASIKLLMLFVLLSYHSNAYPVYKQLRFEHIELPVSLQSRLVNCFLQDQQGFIWIGSGRGLLRYDGYKATVVDRVTKEGEVFKFGFVTSLIEDASGKIWIGTSKGVFIYDQTTEISTTIEAVSEVNCRAMYRSRNGDIIVGTENGIRIITPKTSHVEAYVHQSGIDEGLSHDIVRCIYEDQQGILWIGTYDQLNRFDRTSNTFTHYRLKDVGDAISANNLILAITPNSETSDSLLWVGTETGLCLLNTRTGKFKIYRQSVNSNSLSNNVIKTCCVVKPNEIWLGTDMGLNIFDVQNEIFYSYFHQYENSYSISNNVIISLLKDNNGYVWLGTDNGVDKIYISPKKILRNQLKEGAARLKYGMSVNDFTVDENGNTWIASDEGVIKYDKNNDSYQYFAPPTILHSKIKAVHADQKGRIWIATSGGLNVYDIDKDSFISCVAEKNNPLALKINYINCITEDQKGNIWIGSHKTGIYKVVEKPGQKPVFVNFSHKPEDSNSLSSNIINDIVCDNEGYLWIATNKGINRFNITSGIFDRFFPKQQERHYISPNYVSQLFCPDGKTVWATTSVGLCKWDKNNQSFKYFSDLPTNINAFVINKKHLWFSSLNKLYRYNPATSQLVNFPLKETGINTYTSGVFADKNGQLYFGGFEGFILFNPDNISIDTLIHEVQLTDFFILSETIKPFSKYNDRLILEKNINATKEIVLKYDENTFSIEFSSLNFDHREASQYAYILDGFDDEWQMSGNNRNFASYTKVKPGKYVFKVKAANSYGLFEDSYRELKIEVRPPIWASNWALVFYGIVLVGVFMAFRSILIARIQFRNDLRFEKLQREKSDEMNQIKLGFFTNISHELRTPLTLIISPVEKLLSRETDTDKVGTLHIIKRNADRLIRLVNQILDLRKIEKGFERLRIQQYNIVKFSERIFNDFSKLAVQRNIDMKFYSNSVLTMIWFDLEKIEKTLYNLLSNALKYTPDGGSITTEIVLTDAKKTEDSPTHKYVVIKVSDTGVGIPEKDQPHIFERFTNVKVKNFTSQEGTGIGLSLVRDYVEMHNGFIKPESEENKGSIFSVYLPFAKELLTDYIENKNDDWEQQDEPAHFDENTEKSISEELETAKDNGRKSKVLIVEDDFDMRAFLTDSMKEEFQVLVAVDGVEGWNMATEHSPDMIISDVMMANMDGIELCKKLKTDIRTSHIPVVLLTAKGGIENKIEGIESGADDYVQKPVNVECLLLRTKKLIEQREFLRKSFTHKHKIEPSEITVNSIDEQFLEKLLATIEKQIDNSELNVKMLSEMMALSHTNLYRKIKALTGQTATEFIRTIRLKRAAQLLKNKHLNVTDVMYMVGFSHRSYFTRSFKEMFGVSPKEYN